MIDGASRNYKRGNESDRTYSLKWAAWEWLYSYGGCRSIGLEVKLEGPIGRSIDVVGVGPANVVYVVEVKASRADLFRDDHGPGDLAKLAAKAPSVEGRSELARQILDRASEHARREDPDNWECTEPYRFAKREYERLSRQQEAYRRRLESYSIKFRDPRFGALGDFHYIMAPTRLIRRREVPPHWGLLDDIPSEAVPAPRKDMRRTSVTMSNVLRAIARANSTSMMRHREVTFEGGEALFPRDTRPDLGPGEDP